MILSICIPTYNRLPFLEELLPAILGQVDADCAEVEVAVSDNASTDGTADYLRSLSHPSLRWWTNETNIGGDRNFLKCVAEAKGGMDYLANLHEIDKSSFSCRLPIAERRRI